MRSPAPKPVAILGDLLVAVVGVFLGLLLAATSFVCVVGCNLVEMHAGPVAQMIAAARSAPIVQLLVGAYVKAPIRLAAFIWKAVCLPLLGARPAHHPRRQPIMRAAKSMLSFLLGREEPEPRDDRRAKASVNGPPQVPELPADPAVVPAGVPSDVLAGVPACRKASGFDFQPIGLRKIRSASQRSRASSGARSRGTVSRVTSDTWTTVNERRCTGPSASSSRASSGYAVEYNRLASDHGLPEIRLAQPDNVASAQETMSMALVTVPSKSSLLRRLIGTTPSARVVRKGKKSVGKKVSSGHLTDVNAAHAEWLQSKGLHDIARHGGLSNFILPSAYSAGLLVVPTCLAATGNYIVQNWAAGIFRVPGSFSIVNALFEHYARQTYRAERQSTQIQTTIGSAMLPTHIPFAAHDVASVFKKFLNCLSGGILGSVELFETLRSVEGHVFRDARFAQSQATVLRPKLIALAIASLDTELHISVICAVFGLLSMIGSAGQCSLSANDDRRESQPTEMMGFHALAVVFGPLLLGNLATEIQPNVGEVPGPFPTTAGKLVPMQLELARQVSQAKIAVDVTEMLISNWIDVARHLRCSGALGSVPEDVRFSGPSTTLVRTQSHGILDPSIHIPKIRPSMATLPGLGRVFGSAEFLETTPSFNFSALTRRLNEVDPPQLPARQNLIQECPTQDNELVCVPEQVIEAPATHHDRSAYVAAALARLFREAKAQPPASTNAIQECLAQDSEHEQDYIPEQETEAPEADREDSASMPFAFQPELTRLKSILPSMIDDMEAEPEPEVSCIPGDISSSEFEDYPSPQPDLIQECPAQESKHDYVLKNETEAPEADQEDSASMPFAIQPELTGLKSILPPMVDDMEAEPESEVSCTPGDLSSSEFEDYPNCSLQEDSSCYELSIMSSPPLAAVQDAVSHYALPLFQSELNCSLLDDSLCYEPLVVSSLPLAPVADAIHHATGPDFHCSVVDCDLLDDISSYEPPVIRLPLVADAIQHSAVPEYRHAAVDCGLLYVSLSYEPSVVTSPPLAPVEDVIHHAAGPDFHCTVVDCGLRDDVSSSEPPVVRLPLVADAIQHRAVPEFGHTDVDCGPLDDTSPYQPPVVRLPPIADALRHSAVPESQPTDVDCGPLDVLSSYKPPVVRLPPLADALQQNAVPEFRHTDVDCYLLDDVSSSEPPVVRLPLVADALQHSAVPEFQPTDADCGPLDDASSSESPVVRLPLVADALQHSAVPEFQPTDVDCDPLGDTSSYKPPVVRLPPIADAFQQNTVPEFRHTDADCGLLDDLSSHKPPVVRPPPIADALQQNAVPEFRFTVVDYSDDPTQLEEMSFFDPQLLYPHRSARTEEEILSDGPNVWSYEPEDIASTPIADALQQNAVSEFRFTVVDYSDVPTQLEEMSFFDPQLLYPHRSARTEEEILGDGPNVWSYEPEDIASPRLDPVEEDIQHQQYYWPFYRPYYQPCLDTIEEEDMSDAGADVSSHEPEVIASPRLAPTEEDATSDADWDLSFHESQLITSPRLAPVEDDLVSDPGAETKHHDLDSLSDDGRGSPDPYAMPFKSMETKYFTFGPDGGLPIPKKRSVSFGATPAQSYERTLYAAPRCVSANATEAPGTYASMLERLASTYLPRRSDTGDGPSAYWQGIDDEPSGDDVAALPQTGDGMIRHGAVSAMARVETDSESVMDMPPLAGFPAGLPARHVVCLSIPPDEEEPSADDVFAFPQTGDGMIRDRAFSAVARVDADSESVVDMPPLDGFPAGDPTRYVVCLLTPPNEEEPSADDVVALPQTGDGMIRDRAFSAVARMDTDSESVVEMPPLAGFPAGHPARHVVCMLTPPNEEEEEPSAEADSKESYASLHAENARLRDEMRQMQIELKAWKQRAQWAENELLERAF
ncbi:MAG: hypothetical protein M1826_002299 [Phylliscum demangeonii]|nr:MAG: hypothetical protein M1826_002299 [Phylliscum demangeonii]